MKMLLIPGYQELFGQPNKSYEEYMADISSELGASIAGCLSNELNANHNDRDNQKRIGLAISKRFTSQQTDYLRNAYIEFGKKNPGIYEGDKYAKRYMLNMFLKELNRKVEVDSNPSPQQEFNILMAYLLIVNTVNDLDNDVFNREFEHKGKSDFKYRILWSHAIGQYQFNERVDHYYQLFKLICFLKYCKITWRPYLKEYINSLGFSTLSFFLGSFNQLIQLTDFEDSSQLFSKLIRLETQTWEERLSNN